MKTLTGPVTSEIAAEQSGWCEVYDIYLKSSISTPFGVTDVIRITALPGGLDFFTPQTDPEPEATQGDAQNYQHWPIERRLSRGDAKFTNDKLTIMASNVTGEWGAMLALVDWHDVPFVIRKVSLTIAEPTASDCVVVFSGLVDSVQVTREQLQFVCSNDLGTFNTIAPRENMHQNCRFNWADDQCTAIRFRAENYKAKECGSGSTTTEVRSDDLTEDAGSGPYDGMNVTADASTNRITLAAHGLKNNAPVRFGGTPPAPLVAGTWYYAVSIDTNDFKVSELPGADASPIDFLDAGVNVTLDSAPPYGTDLVNALADIAITASSEVAAWSSEPVTADVGGNYITLANHGLSLNDPVSFSAGTMPSPLVAATTYYVLPISANTFQVAATPNGTRINIDTPGSAVLLSTPASYEAHQVRTNNTATYWKFSDPTDWGTNTQGYWQLDDAQSGLENADLTPWIQFDFGSAKTPRLWRLTTVADLQLEELARMVQFFSSADVATWTFEGYEELPPEGGTPHDILMPSASTARYWRICIRTRWAESVFYAVFKDVEAYESGRNWWASGEIRFDAATDTVALRNVSARVLESYSGKVFCSPLPAAPASGDTFVIERGCPRTFNGCCERRNWENFGGFLDMPHQLIIR